MIFLWPWMLPVLITIPLLVAYYVWLQRRRAHYAIRYSSLSLVKQALDKPHTWRRHIPPVLFLLGLSAMLFALARPYSVVTLPKQEATIILAIDVSGSMRAEDLKPSRIEAAKTAARAFISKQDAATRIGIVAFSNTAMLVQAPTLDHDAARAAIERLYLQRSTGIGYGILMSLDAIFEYADVPLASQAIVTPVAVPTPLTPLRTPTPVPVGYHVPSIVVLLTDGQNTTGVLPVQAAEKAAQRGVRIYTIGVGTTQGATIQPPSGFSGGGPGGFGGGGGGGFRATLDEKTLRAVAEMTDGEYFHASDENALLEIYQNLDTQTILRTERTEITSLFTAGAIGLLLFGGILSLFWFNRLP